MNNSTVILIKPTSGGKGEILVLLQLGDFEASFRRRTFAVLLEQMLFQLVHASRGEVTQVTPTNQMIDI